MSIKLFGNSRAPRLQKNEKKKAKVKTKRTALDRVISLFLALVTLESLYCTAVFSNIPVIADYRTRFIATAMETMRHRWIATSLFPPAVVKAVTDQMAATQEAQIGVNSNWNQGTTQDENKAAAPETEEPVAEETTAAQEDAAEVPEDQTETAE